MPQGMVQTCVGGQAGSTPRGSCPSATHQSTPDIQEQTGYMIQPSKPGDEACGTCHKNTSHSLDLHVCSFCLCMVHKLCKHPETQCKCKEGEAKNGAEVGGLRQATPRLHSDIGLTKNNSDIACHTAHLVDIPAHSSASPPAPPVSDIHPALAATQTSAPQLRPGVSAQVHTNQATLLHVGQTPHGVSGPHHTTASLTR